jgi:hypothetical protein
MPVSKAEGVPDRLVFSGFRQRAKTAWRATQDVSIGWRAIDRGSLARAASTHVPADTTSRSIALARCLDARSPSETLSAHFDEEFEMPVNW